MNSDPHVVHENRNLGACPECEHTSHIQACVLTRPKGKSGQCLAIGLVCEAGHRWVISIDDHSGGLWPSCHVCETEIAPG